RSLALFDKPDPLEGPFFEETIYVTPSRETASTQSAIVETVTRAARALGLWHGPLHAEARVNDAGVFMLEIAARPIGGLCARALRFRLPGQEHPIPLEEFLVLHAIGEMPPEYAPAAASTGVMMIPVPRAGVFQAVRGVDKAMATPGVEDVIITAKPGETLVPLPEGASYTGFLFAGGPDAQATENSLRKAHGALRFDILSALDVLRQEKGLALN
ncbi:MAG: ATP-grasp domain-containing protein, partial [Acidobacteriota bacterium]